LKLFLGHPALLQNATAFKKEILSAAFLLTADCQFGSVKQYSE